MRVAELLFLSATCVWSTPVVVTTENSVSCTAYGDTVTDTGMPGHFASSECGVGQPGPLSNASARTRSWYSYDTNSASIITNASITTYGDGSATALSHVNLLMNRTTDGPVREGRADIRITVVGEHGRGYVWVADVVNYETGSCCGDFWRVPFTLGQPFQIEADNITHGDPWRANGALVQFEIFAQEPRIVTDWEGTYTVWDPVSILEYDPATATPEPSSVLLIGSGLVVCACRHRRPRMTRFERHVLMD